MNFYQSESRKQLKKLRDLQPDLYKSFIEFDKKVFEEGTLTAKTKRLIAIAAAHITQCPYCIEGHVKDAKKIGISNEEIAETIFVAMALKAGSSFMHSCIAFDTIDSIENP